MRFYIGRCFIAVVSSISGVDREGMVDATVFRTIKFSISIWLNLAFSYLHVQTVQKSIWPNERGNTRLRIEVGSIQRFENCSRVMESCFCVIARNANSDGRFSDEIKAQI